MGIQDLSFSEIIEALNHYRQRCVEKETEADRIVIGEMPQKGMTLVINDLKFIVFSVETATDGGTVVLKLQGS